MKYEILKPGEIYPLPDYCKVLVEKEYNNLRSASKNRSTIAGVMMVKNEKKRIHVTLESIKTAVDCLIIYDTGSEDNTIEIITSFCEKHQINLYLIQGKFVNFSVSRNVLLDYCDKFPVEYLLLLDCNDELQGEEQLKAFCREFRDKPNSGFLITQKWYSPAVDKYWNVRLVKNKHCWRYIMPIHEYIKDCSTEKSDPVFPIIKGPDTFCLYQDRTQDDDKSLKRFARDYAILLEDYKNGDPEDVVHYTRTLFYLSQTCECLTSTNSIEERTKMWEETLFYTKERLLHKGFEEEIFHSFMRAARATEALGYDWKETIGWLLKAFEHTPRAEALTRIAGYYMSKNIWHAAYMFIRQACELNYPKDLILFVDSSQYDYWRWHMLGTIAFYVGRFQEGKQACLKALEAGLNKAVDSANLQKYIDMEKGNSQGVSQGVSQGIPFSPPTQHPSEQKNVLTKNQFIEKTISELREKYPKLPIKSMQSRANKMWKESRDKGFGIKPDKSGGKH